MKGDTYMEYTKEKLEKWLATGSAKEVTEEDDRAERIRVFSCYWGTLVITSEEMDIIDIE